MSYIINYIHHVLEVYAENMLVEVYSQKTLFVIMNSPK